ncbi:MAG TPA: IPT/TIG domain-containing protein [Verrucomicrobiae bacterium]|nr:IPT/TIG domain-containing protein [Verrucomicrobiae bacterium]
MLPTIYNVSPGLGSTGTAVTISGAGLNEKSPHPDVSIGGGTVTAFGTVSPNALSFNVPATAGSGLITITTTNGSISSAQLFYLPASISSFTPIGGPAGTIVKITGNNFTNASAVMFSGTPASAFVVTNNNTIGAVAPAGVTSGLITVTTPFGTTNSATLFYGPPAITGFAPTHGLPGTNVIVSGSNFTNATAVLFNGTPAASFTVINNTTLSAIVPTNVTTGKITVAAPGGTNSSATDFTVDSADLSVTVSTAPNPVFVGSNLVYTVTVTNGSPTADISVNLSSALPASVNLTAISAPVGSLVSTNGNLAVFNLGTLNANGSLSIGLTVVPQVPGSITNIAWASGAVPDANLLNNTNSVATTVWPLPFLSITNLTSNNLVQISWPAPLSNFTLQFKGNLTNVVWTNETASKTLAGTNVSVVETNIGFSRFFRLTN